MAVGIVHATALENQEGRRFRDTDSARAAGSIGKGTAVSAAMTIGVFHLVGAGMLPERDIFLTCLLSLKLLQS